MEDNDIRILILDILKKFYDENPHNYVQRQYILKNYELSSNELDRNIVYLEQKYLIDIQWMMGGNFLARINSFGIDELVRIRSIPETGFKEENSAPDKMIASIFDETKVFVDAKLEDLNPDMLTKLDYIYEDLLTRNNHHNYERIAFSCREILMDFTEAIFNVDSLKENEEIPTRNQTKNKIYYRVREITESETDSKLMSERFEYICNYFSALNDLIQKNLHPDGFQVESEDAKACLIYTYLFLRDILKLVELNNS